MVESIKVCDAIMGSGKSESAIRYMNNSSEKFIYVGMYLSEIDRIIESCDKRGFVQPSGISGKRTKLDDLHKLLKRGKCIATTHALFSAYNKTTKDLISKGGYILVLDEAFWSTRPYNISTTDIEMMLRCEIVSFCEDGETLKWKAANYDGDFLKHKAKIEEGKLKYISGISVIEEFSYDIFDSFKEIIVLTYMYEAQIQSYYFQKLNVPIQKIGIKYDGGVYSFSDKPVDYVPPYTKELWKKIHIVDRVTKNGIGDGAFSLSGNWYDQNPQLHQRVKASLRQFFCGDEERRQLGVWGYETKSRDRMWTCYLKDKDSIQGNFSRCFVECNARATNKYSRRHYLAYLINVYHSPWVCMHYKKHGISVDRDGFALSEMVQWIWRSAIRNGEEIWVYIPSERMRNLLIDWIFELSGKKPTVEGAVGPERKENLSRLLRAIPPPKKTK